MGAEEDDWHAAEEAEAKEKHEFKESNAAAAIAEQRAELDKEIVEDQAFWFRVLQIALANLDVQSIGKAAEVSRRSLEETIELSNKIRKVELK